MSTSILADDLLVGAKAISEWTGLPLRTIYAMRENHHPAVKREVGIGLCARKSALATLGLRTPLGGAEGGPA